MSGSHAAAESARRFLDAVQWGEHHDLWALLSPAAKSASLAVAERNGLDALVAARARAGTWTDQEADNLLADLVRGLRADLASVEVADIIVGEPLVDGYVVGISVTVAMTVPSLLPDAVTGGEGWAAGTIDMVHTPTGWLVDRLNARRVWRP